MKIIAIDNLYRDYIPDKLIIQLPLLKPKDAKTIVDILNDSSGDDSPYFYKVVSDNYELRKIEF